VIDDGVPSEWNPEVLAVCRRFRQGNLVERPPFLYVANPQAGVWWLTTSAGDNSTKEDLFELSDPDRPPYGMIVTETCDLAEEDARTPRIPWITICPVYDLAGRLSGGQLSNLQSNRIQYLRLLNSASLPDGIWIVDFRIEIPIEKSWLVGRTPIGVYESELDYAKLARALAARRERPVISGDVHKALIKPLRRWLERLSDPRKQVALAGISEVRVLLAGSPLDPDGASLLILTEKSLFEETRKEWDSKWPSLKTRMDEVGVPLLETKYATLDSCTAREYLDSFQIDLSFAL